MKYSYESLKINMHGLTHGVTPRIFSDDFLSLFRIQYSRVFTSYPKITAACSPSKSSAELFVIKFQLCWFVSEAPGPLSTSLCVFLWAQKTQWTSIVEQTSRRTGACKKCLNWRICFHTICCIWFVQYSWISIKQQELTRALNSHYQMFEIVGKFKNPWSIYYVICE